MTKPKYVTETLTSERYLQLLRQGAARLEANRETINDLNVFPIPDGDTGDNMHMTLCGGTGVAPAGSLGETARAASQGMLLGARGNSGVILSRFFAGIAKGLSEVQEADLPTFIQALQEGVRSAYGAVSQPVEGTMLTVLREGVAQASGADFSELFHRLAETMQASLDRTPELLPVLKEAGVVDSGGAGVLCIIEGMLDAWEGRLSEAAEDTLPTGSPGTIDLDRFGPEAELTFGYCTEFLLRLQTAKVGDPEGFDESGIRDWLNSVGESVVCFKDGSIVKVHVHTQDPGSILSYARRWGEFLTVKIENMTLQHSGATIRNRFSDRPAETGPQERFAQRHRRYAVVTVASGEGLVRAFRDAGVEEVIPGGQTMNPSAADFIAAFERAGAETVFVFPNNANILLTARQAASLYDKAEVIVLPSKDIGAGYVAAASVDRSLKDPADIAEAAEAAIRSVTTGQVSRANRDARMDGVEVHDGDYIGYGHDCILCACADRSEAARRTAGALALQDHDVVLVFRGQDVPEEEAESLVAALQAESPRTEIILTDGGQPIIDYILTLC